MEINFAGGAYEGRSSDINAQKCQNLFPVIDQLGGKAVVSLFSTPGLTEYIDLGYSQGVRGMIRVFDVLYAVCGKKIFKIGSIWSVPFKTEITGTFDTDTGQIFMAHNGSYVVIVDKESGKGYYIDTTGTTLTQITDADFPTASSLTMQDNYFIVTEANTGRIYISASGDPTSWNALDFATAEAHPDYAEVVRSLNRELWIFGGETIEVFYNSGNASFPFERIPGSVKNIGIGAFESIASSTDSLFFLADDHSIYTTLGLQISKISPTQIDYQIQKLQYPSQAIGYCYSQEGHSFYVITFPASEDSVTFVYDITTQMWHTRASGALDYRHPANCHAFMNNKNLVGHYNNGKILYYDFTVFDDDGEILNRIRRAKAVFFEKKTVFHNILEIEFEGGTGLVTGQGTDPQAMLRWSDDGGHTWSNEHWTGIGKIGEYDNRARWKKLGRSRDRIYEVKISDPIKVVIVSADLLYTLGNT